MKKITYAFLILMMTAACAKDSKDDAGNAQQIATVPPPEVTQQGQGQYPPNGGYQQGGYQPGYQQGNQRPPYGYQPVGANCNTNYQQFTTLEQYCRALRIDIRRNNCVTQQHTTAYRQFCSNQNQNQGPYRR